MPGNEGERINAFSLDITENLQRAIALRPLRTGTISPIGGRRLRSFLLPGLKATEQPLPAFLGFGFLGAFVHPLICNTSFL
jgi:hypothetical protein